MAERKYISYANMECDFLCTCAPLHHPPATTTLLCLSRCVCVCVCVFVRRPHIRYAWAGVRWFFHAALVNSLLGNSFPEKFKLATKSGIARSSRGRQAGTGWSNLCQLGNGHDTECGRVLPNCGRCRVSPDSSVTLPMRRTSRNFTSAPRVSPRSRGRCPPPRRVTSC